MFSRGVAVALIASTSVIGHNPGGGFGGFGGGGGGFGGGGYEPPAPQCQAFQCKKGTVAVTKPDHRIWSYGCKESGMNIFNAGAFDANNPTGGMGGQKNIDKCCIERDICKQTCGTTSVECHNIFQKCQKKICAGDQNCGLQAMMADMGSDPVNEEEEKDDKKDKYDPEKTKCKGYKYGQNVSCMCVAKDEVKSANEEKLKLFYKEHNADKLDSSGEIKDLDEVYKKWTGKMPQMFMALANKYKEKAVEKRKKPEKAPRKDDYKKDDYHKDKYKDYQPPTPPPTGKSKTYNAAPPDPSGTSSRDSATAGHEDIPRRSASSKDSPYKATKGDDDIQFDEKLARLKVKKIEAVDTEDFDAAGVIKEEMVELSTVESKRLMALKDSMIQEEDYLGAKNVKFLIQRLEL